MQSRRLRHIEVSVDFTLVIATNIFSQWLMYRDHMGLWSTGPYTGLMLGLVLIRRYTTRYQFSKWAYKFSESYTKSGQPKWHSGLEIGVDTLIGWAVAIIGQLVFYAPGATATKVGGLTGGFYIWTIFRRYWLRRIFNWIEVRERRKRRALLDTDLSVQI